MKMPKLLETCAKLLKLAERIGDDEGHRKSSKEGTSTGEQGKSQSRVNTRKMVGKSIRALRVGLPRMGRISLPRTRPKVGTSLRNRQVTFLVTIVVKRTTWQRIAPKQRGNPLLFKSRSIKGDGLACEQASPSK